MRTTRFLGKAAADNPRIFHQHTTDSRIGRGIAQAETAKRKRLTHIIFIGFVNLLGHRLSLSA
jgi:hypothetical protein